MNGPSAQPAGESDAARIARFYDRWSPAFVAAAGHTFQSGLVKAADTDREDPDASTRLCAALAGMQDGDHVVDAGCGVGGPACALLRAFPRATLVGVTLSSVQAQMAEELARRHGVADRARFVVGDYHALPMQTGQCDRVFFFECTGYSPDPAALYCEAARVLRPGGTVYVKDVFAKALPWTEAEAEKLRAFDALWACVRTGTLAEAAAAATAAGLEVSTRLYPHVGTARFLGAMIGDDGRPNAFGRGFLDTFAPIVFGELVGAKPT